MFTTVPELILEIIPVHLNSKWNGMRGKNPWDIIKRTGEKAFLPYHSKLFGNAWLDWSTAKGKEYTCLMLILSQLCLFPVYPARLGVKTTSQQRQSGRISHVNLKSQSKSLWHLHIPRLFSWSRKKIVLMLRSHERIAGFGLSYVDSTPTVLITECTNRIRCLKKAHTFAQSEPLLWNIVMHGEAPAASHSQPRKVH